MIKEGSLVTIYKDYQNEKEPMGVAKLVQLTKIGYPFILEEQNEHQQETYSTQYWKVEWIEKISDTINPERNIYPIRILENIGLTMTSTTKDDTSNDDNLLLDKFLSVDGVEIY